MGGLGWGCPRNVHPPPPHTPPVDCGPGGGACRWRVFLRKMFLHTTILRSDLARGGRFLGLSTHPEKKYRCYPNLIKWQKKMRPPYHTCILCICIPPSLRPAHRGGGGGWVPRAPGSAAAGHRTAGRRLGARPEGPGLLGDSLLNHCNRPHPLAAAAIPLSCDSCNSNRSINVPRKPRNLASLWGLWSSHGFQPTLSPPPPEVLRKSTVTLSSLFFAVENFFK